MAVDRVTALPDGHARMRRLLLLALVIVGLAPGTFLRTPIGLRSDPAVVTITPLAERAGVSGELALTGAWELTSKHGWFGGFSALAASTGENGGPALIAATDRGLRLDLDLSGEQPRAIPGSFRFIGISMRGRRQEYVDLESLARDPASGTLWAGFEFDNLIVRYAKDGTPTISAPPAMAEWSLNSGAETMERLADGRFLVIAEGAEPRSDWLHQALVFPGDPAEGATPVMTWYRAPPGYDPVDAAALPGGRLLILLRRVVYSVPARFDTMIALADLGDIRPGAQWDALIVERLEGGVFADNFEGIAYVPSREDPAKGSIWLIVDDNLSIFQRSLLVRFDWPG